MELQVIDISNMTIAEVNNEIKHLENDLNYYLNEMDRVWERTQPRAIIPTTDRVQGGTTKEEKFAKYVEEISDPEYKMMSNKVQNMQNQMFHLMRYVESELRRIGEYGAIEDKIVVLRDNKLNNKQRTWEQIAKEVNYCSKQCWRIYKKYKGERNV